VGVPVEREAAAIDLHNLGGGGRGAEPCQRRLPCNARQPGEMVSKGREVAYLGHRSSDDEGGLDHPRRVTCYCRSRYSRRGIGFGLVHVYRAEIEQHIRRAEMENWKDALGVLPQSLDGFYHR